MYNCNDFNETILPDTWHLLAKYHHEQETMGKNRTRRCSNHEKMKEVETYWPCLEKGKTSHLHQNGNEVKSSGEDENKKTKAIMETHSDKRAGQHWEDTG